MYSINFVCSTFENEIVGRGGTDESLMSSTHGIKVFGVFNDRYTMNKNTLCKCCKFWQEDTEARILKWTARLTDKKMNTDKETSKFVSARCIQNSHKQFLSD